MYTYMYVHTSPESKDQLLDGHKFTIAKENV